MKPEVYISVDVETDGPIPGPHSMLSLGAAAFMEDGSLVGTFSVNLETLPGASADPKTAAWWETQPQAWAACRTDPRPPEAAMATFASWVESFQMTPVFVGYPAGFDFLFVYWYLIRFLGWSPFSFSALDIKSFAMALLGTKYRATTKSRLPMRWQSKHPHTHVAVDDAIEQGELFMNMLKESRKKP